MEPLKAQKSNQKSPDNGAPNVMHPPQSDHNYKFNRKEKVKSRGVDKIHIVSVKASSQRCQNGRVDKNHYLESGDIHSHGIGSHLAYMDGS